MSTDGNGFFIAIGGQQRGPFAVDRLLVEGVVPSTLVWREGMTEWLPASAVAELAGLFVGRPVAPPIPPRPVMSVAYDPRLEDARQKKILAGVLAIVLGGLGIHKFVLGRTGAGLLMLAGTIFGLCIIIGPAAMHIIGIIEGVIYLTKTDEEFYQVYVVQQKSWF